MPGKFPTSVIPSCAKCGKQTFELRLLRDEGLGVAKCTACERDYLLLDSGDYWFDVMQQGYPKVTRCGCKSEAFTLRMEYDYRDDGDVCLADVWATCASCGKSKRQLRVEIDYGPTDQLVARPLVYCKNPKILYDLKELTLYAKQNDICRVVRLLAEMGCNLVGWIREQGDVVQRELDVAAAEQAVRANRYQMIYACPGKLRVSDEEVATAKGEAVYWKRREIIRLDAPFEMMWGSKTTKLYYLHFSNEYVDQERVVAKSARFRRLTARLTNWLANEFVSWRGPDCFDNPQEHIRIFGNKYRSKAKSVRE